MALQVESLHFYPYENASKHHTDRFEIVHLDVRVPVLRRGQVFQTALRFTNREFVKGKDQIRIIFSNGDNSNPLKGTKGIVFVNEKIDTVFDATKWAGKLTGIVDKTITMDLISPLDAPVGPWEVKVECGRVGSADRSDYTYDQDFWLLFNPWMKGDLSHMPETEKLDEYILSDVGKIWIGPWGSCRGREWAFGQFDKCVLPACMLMLDRANLSHSNRGDPILISRAISRAVNSNDDHGVLVGRWDGNYVDGTAPSAWTGSIDILEQYLTSQEEVKYGQCWVFAGVVTTVCRALGIPSRVVSNLVSAHDSNGSLTVDKYYDKDNKELNYDPLNSMGEDSVWNYHVWNDVYMERPDLPKGYGGWQAIDATPQETSSNFYQCGPASLEAVRQGAVGLNFDVPFIIASVNADFMKWKEDSTKEMGFRRIECNQYHIGRMILTKQPWMFDLNGDRDREEITAEYKAEEGSKGERLSLYNAVRNTTRAKRFYDVSEVTTDDVSFSLTDLEKVDIGQPFHTSIKLENTSNEGRNVEVILTVGSIYYTGVKAKDIKRSAGEIFVRPNSTEYLKMSVQPNEYLDKLVEYSILKINAICTVKETKQTWAAEDDFQVIKPNLDIKIPKEINLDETVVAYMSFVNPLAKNLTDCQFNLSGPRIIPRTITIPSRDCRPGERAHIAASVTPMNTGNFKLVATFTSRELSDITGSAMVDVL